MDTSLCDSAEPNKSSPLPGNSDIDMEQTDAYSDDGTPADTDNNPQTPAGNDESIETGNDITEESSDSPVNLKTKETQTVGTKQSIVLKLQPLSDLDIDIWSNKVVQYHIFKADNSVEPPKTEENLVHEGYSLREHSKLKKDKELSVSLRGHKEIDYSPILTTGVDSEPKSGYKKPKNHWASASGPSAIMTTCQ